MTRFVAATISLIIMIGMAYAMGSFLKINPDKIMLYALAYIVLSNEWGWRK